MNSKILNYEEKIFKIEGLKTKAISDITNQKKILKGLKEGKDNQIFNQKTKCINTKISDNKYLNPLDENIVLDITNKKLGKKCKTLIKKINIEPLIEKPIKLKGGLVQKKLRKKYNFSNPKFFPRKVLIMFFNEEEGNNNKTNGKVNKKRTKSFNKTKKEQNDLFKKIFAVNYGSFLDGNVSLVTAEILKKNKYKINKRKNLNKTESLNYANMINEYNNIISKPQCLYKGPLKIDKQAGEEDSNIKNQSLFRAFMSRNLKSARTELSNHLIEGTNKDSQAVTFEIEYNNNGTMRTKRIFTSTFNNNYYDKSTIYNNEEIKTIENKNNGKKTNKRTFGGIMLSNHSKLF